MRLISGSLTSTLRTRCNFGWEVLQEISPVQKFVLLMQEGPKRISEEALAELEFVEMN